MVIGSNQRVHALSNNQINIEIDGKSIKRVNEAKSLGLLIDDTRPFISESSALQIYQALILLDFDYCSSVTLP